MYLCKGVMYLCFTASKESFISWRISVELSEACTSAGYEFFPYDFLIFTCLFPFDYYCNNCFLSALPRWRNLWSHRSDFSRKFSSCSHSITELATHFSRHTITSFSTHLFRQHSVFNNSKAMMRIVQFFSEDDVLFQVRYTSIHVKSPRNHLDTRERYVKEVLYVKEIGVIE